MVMKMNRLQYEKSPYLLQHADNPVDWRPWGAEAFDAARSEDRPVFLSIGYSTCHWCHVMARESFADAEVARALNRDFIPIKVDREERPDVDAAYMAACVAMTGSGGWPLTVLLTPEQTPFWAGTYLPKDALLGLLAQAAALWRARRGEVRADAEKLTEALRAQEEAAPADPAQALVAAGAQAFAAAFDREWGGFGRAPKFPSAHNLLFLLRYAGAAGDERAAAMALRTMEHMYRGGIYDHVGGGFARYATDRRWLAPHFEKTLYDNALLALAYAEAWRTEQQPWLRRAARETLDYVLRELADPAGGFCCGQDADSEGEEGKYYLFTPSELSAVLGDGEPSFCARFGIRPGGNFHGRSIPNLIDAPDWADEPAAIAAARQAVYAYRRSRTALHRDDKVLTGWNGLAIAAFSRAGLVLDAPRYLRAAAQAADFLRREMRDGQGRLLARWCGGEAAHPGKLEDYAFLAWGLLEFYGATFDVAYLEDACRVSDGLLTRFFDPERGGFYPYAADGEQLITRSKDAYDGALPSGNAVAALVLDRLGRLTGEQRWRGAARAQFRWLAGAAQAQPRGHGFALLAFTESLWSAGELVCAAPEAPGALTAYLRDKAPGGLAAVLKTDETAARLAALAPFTAAYPIPDAGALYYLCRNGACRAPVSASDALPQK